MEEELKNEITELVKGLTEKEEVAANPPELSAEQKREISEKNIKSLRTKFFSTEPMSDLERVKTAVELRDALVDAGYPDPGMPAGHAFVPGTDTAVQCEHAWNGLRHCVETAQGSDEYFHAELARLMPDKKIL